MSTKVDNILLIEGSKESVAEAAKLILFRSHAYPKHWAFDFDRIVPLPENITSDLTKERIKAWGSSFPHVPPKPLSYKERVLLKSAF